MIHRVSRRRRGAALALAALVMLLPGACTRFGFGARSQADGSVVGDGPRDGPKAFDASRDGSDGQDGQVDGRVDLPSKGDGGTAQGTLAAAQSFGSTGNDQGYDVAVDASGNVIVVGTFQGTMAFGPGNAITSKGGEDGFVAVFSASGATKWVRPLGGSAGNDRVQGVAVDAAGNIYVCGLFYGSVDFGGTTLSAAGSWDLFVASYGQNSALRWARTAGRIGDDFAYDVVADGSGHVLVTGYYEGPVDFGGGSLPVFGGRDVFVAQLDASTGTPLWAKGYGSAGNDTGYGVAVDGSDQVVLVGSYGGAIDFGQGSVGTTAGTFLVKLSPAGLTSWSRAFEQTTAWDLDVERASGRIVLASRISAGADLGTGPLTPSGTNDALVMSLDTTGVQQWYRVFGGTLSDIALGIALDAAGNSYTIGLGGADIDFGAGTVQGQGDQDVFVVSHDRMGQVRWGHLFGGSQQDRGYGVAVGPKGGIYLTGRFVGTSSLGGSQQGLKGVGGDDIFLIKYD